jgi:ComF family protein
MATAWYYFQKGGSVQKIIHELKYNNRKNIGYDLGYLIGTALQNSGFNKIDLIIPVPLHKIQYSKRGYNQSETIALGLSRGLDKPVDTKTLYRTVDNPTQTNKHRYQRWYNVKGVFALNNTENIQNKHILLVDDVITTGATIEACVTTLMKANNVKVSVIALAKA